MPGDRMSGGDSRWAVVVGERGGRGHGGKLEGVHRRVFVQGRAARACCKAVGLGNDLSSRCGASAGGRGGDDGWEVKRRVVVLKELGERACLIILASSGYVRQVSILKVSA